MLSPPAVLDIPTAPPESDINSSTDVGEPEPAGGADTDVATTGTTPLPEEKYSLCAVKPAGVSSI